MTATRREANLQTIPVAVTAFTGRALADNKVFSAGDLANATPSFSYTAFTPLDQELNIRGITNTRLDSPSADPSVGTFVDGVYIGRTGDYNFDFYDLERVEVIRGPQGVLLGRNVVGGALSVITASPSQEASAEVTALVRRLQRHAAQRPRERRLDRHALRAPVVPVPQSRRLRRRRPASSRA